MRTRASLAFVGLGVLSQCAGAPESVPERAAPQIVRFATFNVALFRDRPGALAAELATPASEQARAVAAVLQAVRPDVVLLNEFDYDEGGVALDGFLTHYLAVSQGGQSGLSYQHRFTAAVNTGVPSGRDFDHDGQRDGPGDALGYGTHPGQYGMVLLSRFPILGDRVRTFRRLLWKDMPGALLPPGWYDDADLAVLPLSSKSHWDVAVDLGGCVVHVLASHPTPPVFDGAEDRNGRRNHDEIRLLADLLDPRGGGYLRDDRGRRGGLPQGAHFVIMGDLNADPEDGDAVAGGIEQVLEHPLVQATPVPRGAGGRQQAALQGGANERHRGDPAADTADHDDRRAGNMRLDYVLPSATLEVEDAGVFWPLTADPAFRWIGTHPPVSSDHRLVWVDVRCARLNPRCAPAHLGSW